MPKKESYFGSRKDRNRKIKQFAAKKTDAAIVVGMEYYKIGVNIVVQTWDKCIRDMIVEANKMSSHELNNTIAYLEGILPPASAGFTKAFDEQQHQDGGPDFENAYLVLAASKHGLTQTLSWNEFCDCCLHYAVYRHIRDGLPIPLVKNPVYLDGYTSTSVRPTEEDLAKIADVTVDLTTQHFVNQQGE